MSRFERGRVVISIDDGRKDCYQLFKEILERNSMPATFNIVTGWLGQVIDVEGEIINLSELKEINESHIMEIVAHGHTHGNSDLEVIKSKTLLSEWLNIGGKMGFASPGCQMSGEYVRENGQKLDEMGISYVRGGGIKELPTRSHLKVRELAVKRGYSDYVIKNVAELIYEFENKFVNSVVVYNDTSVEQLKQLTELAIEEKACVIFMFHSVVKKDNVKHGERWSYDFDKFNEFAQFLTAKRDENLLDITTTKDAFEKGLVT